uniref:Uncharacterized protein LOC111130858 n=1 Tax=Crassostrea virginica TaxID=6565 RepID=A0A8B8E1Z4_CRAVI|nr:uncharacterized protein LOC111130858 [Crassostrea virginica]XP_022333823.1 uncharacterized protein LOC111130858 [Crassostrea virginica]
MPSPPRCPAVPIPQYVQMPVLIVPVNEKFELAGRKPDQPMQSQQTPVSGSTACYRRKVQRELNQGKRVKRYAPRLGRNICSKCRQPRTAPDHRHHYGNWFCRATSKETKSKLEERMKSMGFSSRKRKHQVEPCPVFLWQDQRGVDGGQQGDGHDWFYVTGHQPDILLTWDRQRVKKQEAQKLSCVKQLDLTACATTMPLIQALQRPSTLTTSSAPALRYHLPPNTAVQSNIRIRTPPPSCMPSPPRCPAVLIPQHMQMPVLIVPVNKKLR